MSMVEGKSAQSATRLKKCTKNENKAKTKNEKRKQSKTKKKKGTSCLDLKCQWSRGNLRSLDLGNLQEIMTSWHKSVVHTTAIGR